MREDMVVPFIEKIPSEKTFSKGNTGVGHSAKWLLQLLSTSKSPFHQSWLQQLIVWELPVCQALSASLMVSFITFIIILSPYYWWRNQGPERHKLQPKSQSNSQVQTGFELCLPDSRVQLFPLGCHSLSLKIITKTRIHYDKNVKKFLLGWLWQ